MEDSGYLARAAFIMDRDNAPHRTARQVVHSARHGFRLQRTGHHGHAHDRKPSAAGSSPYCIIPFMSCSARVADLYPVRSAPSSPTHARLGAASDCICWVSSLAVITARLMRRLPLQEGRDAVRHGAAALPGPDDAGHAVAHVGSSSAQYLRKMGGLILVASLFCLVPELLSPVRTQPPRQKRRRSNTMKTPTWGRSGRHGASLPFEPLGLNWKAGVAILSGVSAKEIVVSTLGVLYSEQGDATEAELDSASLAQTVASKAAISRRRRHWHSWSSYCCIFPVSPRSWLSATKRGAAGRWRRWFTVRPWHGSWLGSSITSPCCCK